MCKPKPWIALTFHGASIALAVWLLLADGTESTWGFTVRVAAVLLIYCANGLFLLACCLSVPRDGDNGTGNGDGDGTGTDPPRLRRHEPYGYQGPNEEDPRAGPPAPH